MHPWLISIFWKDHFSWDRFLKFLNANYCLPSLSFHSIEPKISWDLISFNKKSCIRETMNLSVCADSSTNTKMQQWRGGTCPTAEHSTEEDLWEKLHGEGKAVSGILKKFAVYYFILYIVWWSVYSVLQFNVHCTV